MSRMKPDRKPPLAKSPIRLRPRRVLGSNSNSNCMQTPAGAGSQRPSDQTLTGCLRKSETARCTAAWEIEEAELRPEYRSISWELRALAKMVGDELGKEDRGGGFGGNSSPLFERGRFYEEYSARRNERLSRKRNKNKTNSTAASASASKCKYDHKLGVTVESTKRNTTSTASSSSRKLQSLRKSVSAAYSVETHRTTTIECETPAPTATPRYMLRSLMNKENKKPPLPQPLYSHKSAIRGGRKIAAPTPTPRVGY